MNPNFVKQSCERACYVAASFWGGYVLWQRSYQAAIGCWVIAGIGCVFGLSEESRSVFLGDGQTWSEHEKK